MSEQNFLHVWKSDPAAFVAGALRDPETGDPFVLYEEQKTFLREALRRTPEGRMRYTELCYSGPKKCGKTGTGAMIVIYTAVALARVNGDIHILANDLDRSTSRVFKAVVQILEASPLLRDSVHVNANRITFRSTGVTIQALPNDYKGFSGANPTLNFYDDSAYHASENSWRLWTRACPAQRLRVRPVIGQYGWLRGRGITAK